MTLMDIMSAEDSIVESIDKKMKVEQLKKFLTGSLTPREKMIIEMRYGIGNRHPLTQREVAAVLKISRSYVVTTAYYK